MNAVVKGLTGIGLVGAVVAMVAVAFLVTVAVLAIGLNTVAEFGFSFRELVGLAIASLAVSSGASARAS